MQYILTIRPGIPIAVRKKIEKILEDNRYTITEAENRKKMDDYTAQYGYVVQSDITFTNET